MSIDCYQLEIIGNTAGEYNVCVLHFAGVTSDSPTPEVDGADLISDFVASVQAAWLAVCASDYTLFGYRAKRVNNTGGPTATVVAPAGTVGTVDGTSAPDQTAQLLTGDYYEDMATPPKWRSGRIFIPSVPENDFENPGWSDAQQAAQAALVTELNTAIGSAAPGPWTGGVWSRKYQVFRTVDWEVSLLVGTVRKRLHPVL